MPNQTVFNQTFNLKELFILNMRTNLWADALYMYLITPMGIIGMLFNTISFIIFLNSSHKVLLFRYMRIYTAFCILIAFMQVFSFYFSAIRLYDLSISFIGRFYKCYLASFGITFLFFYTNVLDVVITIERAVNFSIKYQSFKKTSPFKLSAVLFLICFMINLPNIFSQDMTNETELFVKLRYCTPTLFSQTAYGKALLFLSYFIQGPFVLLLIIFTNSISIYSFRMFHKRKLRATIRSTEEHTPEKIRKQKKIEHRDKKLLGMTFSLTWFSFFILLAQFTCQLILVLFDKALDNISSGWFVFTYSFVVALKQFTNIFFHNYFNRNFRKMFLRMILLKTLKPVREGHRNTGGGSTSTS